ncbi:hypothetical protein C8R47DRAFT_1084902 [Mycena vitilis]|nr:hypothetical protein C8R47DRAFT_1084902 [Mycena vitilis]
MTTLVNALLEGVCCKKRPFFPGATARATPINGNLSANSIAVIFMFIDPGLQPFDPGHESYVYSSFGRVPEGAKVACAAPSWAELSGVKKNSVGAQSEQDIVPNAENFDVQSQTENARTERARNARESCGVTQLMACGSVMVAANMAAGGKPVKGLEADVWALGCAIFEIRAGFPLFESFFGTSVELFEENCFEEDGEPKSVEVPQERASTRLMSIRARLRLIGTEDSPAQDYEGPMMEMSGVRMPEAELELLADLLEKMLRYRPEERIGMDEVVGHPWFA